MAKINLKQAGFTLVELVVVAGLVGLLSIGLVNMFMASVRGSQKARLQAELKSQGDYAMVMMERQLRNAIKLPENTSEGGLSFTVKVEDQQVINVIEMASRNITFKSGDSEPANLFTAPVEVSIAGFQIIPGSGIDPGSVKISLVLEASSQGLAVTQSFQTTVAMRTIK